MNDALRMQISAFVDGELPENENELLLRRLSHDPALRQQVAQYLEIGRLIRREHDVPGMSKLRDRIAAAMGEEPVQHAIEAEIPASRFTRPAVGAAIAASVAVIALFALRQVYAPDESADAVVQPVAITVLESQAAIDPADDELLKQFYLHHDPRLVSWELEFDSEAVPVVDDESNEDQDEEAQD
jgi:negative regulator of sigma E activity